MPNAVKVGFFMTLALLILAAMILKVEDVRLFEPPGQRVDAAFDSVAGLDDKSAVRVAGVRVGRVDGIRLDGDRAIATLLLEQPVELTEGSSASIANLGLLGDKFVLLDPGPIGGRPLPPGTVILGSAPVSFDDALAKVESIGGSIQKAVDSLVEGEEGPFAALPRLLDNLDATTADIRSLIAANRTQVSATIDHFSRFSGTLADELPRLTGQIERVLLQVETVVSENRDDFRDSMGFIRDATEGIRASVDNLDSISGRIARGEGTLGKLVTSEEAHDELVAALSSVEQGVDTLSDTLGRIRKIKLDLGFDSYRLDSVGDFRNAFRVRLQPESDRFYYLELVDDPRGRVRSRTDLLTTTFPDGTTETTTLHQVTTEDKLSVSAQVGLRLGKAALRAGVFESAGGAAVDYHLLENRVFLSLEAFDFSREEDLEPHLRLTGRWRFHPNFFLLGGYDDFLEGERESVFFGAGLTWSDDDLKYLLGSIPSL